MRGITAFSSHLSHASARHMPGQSEMRTHSHLSCSWIKKGVILRWRWVPKQSWDSIIRLEKKAVVDTYRGWLDRSATTIVLHKMERHQQSLHTAVNKLPAARQRLMRFYWIYIEHCVKCQPCFSVLLSAGSLPQLAGLLFRVTCAISNEDLFYCLGERKFIHPRWCGAKINAIKHIFIFDVVSS